MLLRFEGDNFVLDQQVVRAALKAYCQPPSTPRSDFSAFIRLLHEGGVDALDIVFETMDWKDWRSIIKAFEWRAARAVQARAVAQGTKTVDASSDQRLSRAVSEAYVTTQVGEMINSLSLEGLDKESSTILKSLFHLVSPLYFFHLVVSRSN